MALKDRVILYAKGLIMGLAQIIPGVSAGAMAIVTNIYEKFIGAVHSLNPLAEKETDWSFLIVLGLGMGTSFASMSMIIPQLLNSYQSIIFAFFFGLIAAAAVSTYWKTARMDTKTVGLGVIGFILAFFISGLEPMGSYHALPLLFLAGFLAICAMLLPGISGSFVMLLLGQYKYMLNALKQFWVYWADILAVVGGMLVAVFTFPGVIDRLLEWDESAMLSFLIGLMIGALRLPLLKITLKSSFLGNIPLVGVGVIGFFSVLYIEILSR